VFFNAGDMVIKFFFVILDFKRDMCTNYRDNLAMTLVLHHDI